MSIIQSDLLLGQEGSSKYQVSRSLRFDAASTSYLSRTPASAGNRKTLTWSGWVKRSSLSSYQPLFGAVSSTLDHSSIFFDNAYENNALCVWTAFGGGFSTGINVKTAAIFRDPSAWYHIVVAIDTNQASLANAIKVWVNGVAQTMSGTYNSGINTYFNSTVAHGVGYMTQGGTYSYLDGYLAECHLIDGQQLDASSFGATDSTTGQWVPKQFSGSYGSQGWKLTFSDNSAATAAALGKDSAGSNNWTPVNFQATSSYPVITQAKIYCVYNGGTRGANYSVQYSDDNTNWTTAFTGNMTASTCGLITGSGTGNGSYGGHRYWRYVIGAATNDHHPNSARYVLSDGSTDYNIYVYTSDNCSDIGVFGGQGTAYSGQLPLSTSDSLVDTPTSYGTDTGAGGEVRGNYCTWNPLDIASGPTLSNGNLDFSYTSSLPRGCRATFAIPSSGKWYFETTMGGSSQNSIGVVDAKMNIAANPSTYCVLYDQSGSKNVNGSASGYGASFTSGDVIGVAVNSDTGQVTFYKNNTSQGAISLTAGVEYFPFMGGYNSTTSTNFGQRPFAYTAPSGFKALCDTNLPAPVVAKSASAFDVKLYTGNGSTQTISGLGFSPDLVWIKSRSQAVGHFWYDQIRGAGKFISSDSTNAEADFISTLSGFTSDGFSVGNNAGVNNNTSTYVAWTWDAGSSTVTNTQGSITSSVRANASSGFSVSTFTSPSSGAFTFGHGLNVAPSFHIVKIRNASDAWYVYHSSLGAGKYLRLNLTNGETASTSFYNNTAPTSSVITLNGSTWGASWDFVCYSWAPVTGYSSAFSYSGTGNSDGPMVWLGFRPKLVLIKRSDSSENWYLWDTMRDTYNLAGKNLLPNLSNAEPSIGGAFSATLDILSNGFKLRDAGAGTNASGGTYIGFAWAENPFAYARAR